MPKNSIDLDYCKRRATPVSVETAVLISKLTENLKAEFGCDFAFNILARGHYVASHCNSPGIISPTIKPL